MNSPDIEPPMMTARLFGCGEERKNPAWRRHPNCKIVGGVRIRCAGHWPNRARDTQVSATDSLERRAALFESAKIPQSCTNVMRRCRPFGDVTTKFTPGPALTVRVRDSRRCRSRSWSRRRSQSLDRNFDRTVAERDKRFPLSQIESEGIFAAGVAMVEQADFAFARPAHQHRYSARPRALCCGQRISRLRRACLRP